MATLVRSLLQARQAPPPLPPPFTTDEQTRLFIAPGLIGCIISWLLLGTLIVQIYLYHLHFGRDSWRIKLMVYGLLGLELAHTGVVTHYTFEVLVVRWGDPNIIFHPPNTVAAIPFLDGMIGVIVQWFFTYRIWVLGRSVWTKVVCGFIATIAALQCISAMLSSILYWGFTESSSEPLTRINLLVQIWLGASFAVDLLIAATMIYILQVAKNHSGFRATNDIITKLVRQTIQTGAWTAVLALIEVIFLERASNLGNIHLVPGMILGKLYSNSLLVNLNARASRSDGGSSQSESQGAHTYETHAMSRTGRGTNKSRGIAINTVTSTHVDEYSGPKNSDDDLFNVKAMHRV